jgi:transcription-repair coupling factor (superfamily II helicase)
LDLGLVVVDGEQRFGVKHKAAEGLRAVDVLTLTTTPITRAPRRCSASRHQQPPPAARPPSPSERGWPTKDSLLREALLRELDRGGQIYFVHNRVRPRCVAGRVMRLSAERRVSA